MLFSSYEFILLFLPIVLLLYFAFSKTKNLIYQRLILIGASLFFYGYNNPKYLVLILASVVINYAFAMLLQKFNTNRESKLILTLGILFNVFLIGYYKYYDFFIENFNYVFKTEFALKNIILPLGISFFTFQQISFLLAVYKKEEKVEKFVDYMLFITFFPQLVAGPIVLYSEIIPQLKDSSKRYFNKSNFLSGLYIFVIGLFKKVVISDTLAIWVDNGFGTGTDMITAWIITISYTMQIYFDFSGYSDMAIGLGKMFNIDIPSNFLSPYKSQSISEFWRRWHITLGRALSSYIYKPLGGSRCGIYKTCINLLLTFFVSGLWHGAAWTFVIWGILNGMFTVFDRIFKNVLEKTPATVKVFVTFIITNLLWVLFRAETFEQAKNMYISLCNFRGIDLASIADLNMNGIINLPAFADVMIIFSMIAALLFVVFRCKNSVHMLESFVLTKKTAVFSAVIIYLSLIFISRGSVFIYFNF